MDVTLYQSEFFAGRRETVLASARVVVPLVMDLLAPRSVLDLGCGGGEWLEAFALEDSVGVDIAGVGGYVQADLTQPFDLEREFDVVVCLEVGEHLPEDAADTLVDTCTRHGLVVLFSAAVPGQEGKGHINCQPHEYWHDKFAQRGFALQDSIRPLIAAARGVSPWYRDNMFLYLRDG